MICTQSNVLAQRTSMPRLFRMPAGVGGEAPPPNLTQSPHPAVPWGPSLGQPFFRPPSPFPSGPTHCIPSHLPSAFPGQVFLKTRASVSMSVFYRASPMWTTISRKTWPSGSHCEQNLRWYTLPLTTPHPQFRQEETLVSGPW